VNVNFETGGDGATATTHDWLTPPELLQALGPFDMDPCASQYQPWRTAATQFTIEDDGLARDWVGRVWCNPPYGPHAEKFLARMAAHGNGIALIFARTETAGFVAQVWEKATGVLFLHGRLYFHRPDGERAAANSGAPSCLVAYGARAAETLMTTDLAGTYVPLNPVPVHEIGGAE